MRTIHIYSCGGMTRLTKIADWISAAGIRYAHDDGSRLTSITDYDDSTLTYTYDAAGNVATMNDYHSNVTTQFFLHLCAMNGSDPDDSGAGA